MRACGVWVFGVMRTDRVIFRLDEVSPADQEPRGRFEGNHHADDKRIPGARCNLMCGRCCCC